MATKMLWVSLEGRSRRNSPRQRFHSQLCCQIFRYFWRTLYFVCGYKLLLRQNWLPWNCWWYSCVNGEFSIRAKQLDRCQRQKDLDPCHNNSTWLDSTIKYTSNIKCPAQIYYKLSFFLQYDLLWLLDVTLLTLWRLTTSRVVVPHR